MALDTTALLEEFDDLESARLSATDMSVAEEDRPPYTAEDAERYQALDKFIDECGGYVAVRDGLFIEDDQNETKTWAFEFYEATGAFATIPEILRKNIRWPGVWDDLKHDFTDVSLDGTTYWMRG
jgi:hypothetical protein